MASETWLLQFVGVSKLNSDLLVIDKTRKASA